LSGFASDYDISKEFIVTIKSSKEASYALSLAKYVITNNESLSFGT